MTVRRMTQLFCLLTLLVASISPLAFAQDPSGTPPFSTAQSAQFDSINLANLSISVRIPVRSKAGKIPFNFVLTSNSNVYKNGTAWAVSRGFTGAAAAALKQAQTAFHASNFVINYCGDGRSGATGVSCAVR